MKNWTDKEVEILKQLFDEGLTHLEIAQKLGRSYYSVQHKLEALGLLRKNDNQNDLTIDDLSNEIKKYIHQIKINPPKFKIQKSFGKQKEIANLVISDVHAGMINKVYDQLTQREIITYDDEIRKKQQEMYINSIYAIYNLLRQTYYFEKLNIFILGDIITNDRIFEGQTFNISKAVGLQIWDVVFDLSYMINQLSEIFEKIDVYCVVGNHGRTTKEHTEEPVTNNFEYHLYKILELLLKNNSRIKVIVPTTKFYSIESYGHSIFFSHGDNIRGYTTSYAERKAKELLINLPKGYNIYLIGHRHKAERISLSPTSELLISGSWIKQDEYAFKLYGTASKPIQYFFGTSRKRPISWLFQIDFEGM